MKISLRLSLVVALLCAAWSTVASASSMYLVQGIAGRNYSASSDPAFPVDVLLNDEVCYQHGLPFGSIAGPLTFNPGTYKVKISEANSLAPCTNTPLIETSVTIEPQSDVSAIITLNDAGTPMLETITNNLAPVPSGLGRLLLAQAANATTVEVVLKNTTTGKSYTYSVNSGALLDVELTPGTYSVAVMQGSTTLVPSTLVTLYPQSVALLYTIGQSSNNTVLLETRIIRAVV
jgi:hypothetical protein